MSKVQLGNELFRDIHREGEELADPENPEEPRRMRSPNLEMSSRHVEPGKEWFTIAGIRQQPAMWGQWQRPTGGGCEP